jgi:TPR repeat protein
MERLLLTLVVIVSLAGPAKAQLRAQDGLAALESGDAERAVVIWQELATRDDVLALFNLGVLALRGEAGLSADDATEWLNRAAQAGHSPAQALLGDMLIDRQDWAGALHWLEMAASSGEPRAAFLAAQILDQGRAGPPDADRAKALYLRAAQAGITPAQTALGKLLLEQGDTTTAATWFAQAAEQDQPAAQFNLARLKSLGDGVPQDMQAARVLYLRAAQAGLPEAMINLSLMQARGQGGPESFRRALAWAIRADAAHHPEAARLVAALSDVMDPAAQDAARALVEHCPKLAWPAMLAECG